MWYSEEGTGLYNGKLLCGFNVPIKWLIRESLYPAVEILIAIICTAC